MLISDFVTADGTQIVIWRMSEPIEEIMQKFPQLNVYSHHLSTIISEQRKKEFLFSRYLLFRAMGKLPEVAYTDEGKPYLVGEDSHISITHSKDYVAVALNCMHPIGIDLEMRGDRMARLQSRFLSVAELADLAQDEQYLGAHLYWSAKEAIYKLAGKDAVDFRNDIHIHPFDLHDANAVFSAKVIKTNVNYSLMYLVTEHYVFVHACADQTNES